MYNHSRRVPPDKRKRTETSCDKCKLRKQKCDRIQGQTQCRYCELHGIACSITQPRKKRVYGSVKALGSRIVLLEALVKGLLPEADLSSNDEMHQLSKSLGIPLPDVEDHPADVQASPSKQAVENALSLLRDQQGQAQYIGPASSFGFHLKLRRLIGNYTTFEFSVFGRNAADAGETLDISDTSGSDGDGRSRAQKSISNTSSDCGFPSDAIREIDRSTLDSLIDAYFTAGVLRDLIKWQKYVPGHLRLAVADSLAPSSQRPLLLLHVQFHYTVLLMTKSTLLQRATMLSARSNEPLPDAILDISKTCIDSGRALGRLLLKLESINKFNAFTWWDVFYTVTSALILVLDVSDCVKQGR